MNRYRAIFELFSLLFNLYLNYTRSVASFWLFIYLFVLVIMKFYMYVLCIIYIQ